jgi:hypothetical protein
MGSPPKKYSLEERSPVHLEAIIALTRTAGQAFQAKAKSSRISPSG